MDRRSLAIHDDRSSGFDHESSKSCSDTEKGTLRQISISGDKNWEQIGRTNNSCSDTSRKAFFVEIAVALDLLI
jgi:hypothetical protein